MQTLEKFSIGEITLLYDSVQEQISKTRIKLKNLRTTLINNEIKVTEDAVYQYGVKKLETLKKLSDKLYANLYSNY